MTKEKYHGISSGGRIINSSGIINIRSESDIGSYYNAVGHNVIYEYNGNNMIIVRIDPYMASLVGSYIEKRRGGKA